MADKRPALGRGLHALIPPAPPPAAAPHSVAPAAMQTMAPTSAAARATPVELDLDRLAPNPRQPRVHIDDARLDELAQSIRANGIIQPILVRPHGDGYEIVAGERRWRAAQRAGLLKVPVVIRDVPDAKLLEVALVENIQREDLNPNEEAQAYRRLTEDLQLSQESVAAAVGKDRATVANYMRLLRLPAEIRNDVSSGALSMGHARALLALTDDTMQRFVAREVVSRGLSVRETEALVRREGAPPRPPAPAADPNTRAAEDQLKLALGTRVRIVRRGTRGRIEIDYSNEDELQRLYERLVARTT
jgi:ParB family chromosome partitioning protein